MERIIAVHGVADYRQALKMIEIGRSDCIILSDISQSDSLIGFYGLIIAKEYLIEAPAYLFINRKHEKHVGQLAKVLFEMNQESFLKRL